MQNKALFEMLNSQFNEGELQELMFLLAVDYEEVPGTTKRDKAREIINFLDRRGRKDELISKVYELRSLPEQLPTQNSNPDALFKSAIRSQFEGDIGRALQLFQQVKATDPFYPRINSWIKAAEDELIRDYVDQHGQVKKSYPFTINSSGGEGKSAILRLHSANLASANFTYLELNAQKHVFSISPNHKGLDYYLLDICQEILLKDNRIKNYETKHFRLSDRVKKIFLENKNQLAVKLNTYN